MVRICVCTVPVQVQCKKGKKNPHTRIKKNIFRRRRYENQSWRSLWQLSMQLLVQHLWRLHWNLSCDHHGVWFKLDMLGKEARRWRGTTYFSGDQHHNTHMHGMPLTDQSRWKQLCKKHTDKTIWNSKVKNERAARHCCRYVNTSTNVSL